MYALVRSGGVAQYLNELPFSFNGIQRFRSLTPAEQAAHGVLPVVDVTPAYDPAAFRAMGVQSHAVFGDRVEIMRALEAIPPLTPEQQAVETRLTQDGQERAALKNTAALMAFVNMSPVQIDAWISANVNTLSDAKSALALLAKIVNVAARRVVR